MNNSANPSCCCGVNMQEQTEKPSAKVKKTAGAVPSVLVGVLVAFFPKCPLCWAAYMSMFGSVGLARLPYMGWLLPVLLAFLGIHLFVLLKKSSKKGYLPFILSLSGAVIILCGRTFFPVEKWLLVAGMVLVISGSLLNSFSDTRLQFTTNKNHNN